MSNVGYDLDTSGGLMPLIRALIKPPDEDLNVPKPKKPQHPYYKRPGKGHNHDSCDACGEGGDLICCDRCPASFHLGCYDPPLDENDIPAGLWLCKECRGYDAEQPSSSRSSGAQSPADSKSDTEKKIRSSRNGGNSTKKKSNEEEEEAKEPEKELTPMEILVKAAKIMNPKQFELPREMRIPCLFPGTEKDGPNGGSSLVTVDSWGCVPLPARACFVCRATCKLAPLLQCDYCPLLFHQDCLDPPLTALPTGRWMCPNHVEQYIDWKLVNSVSATERVALWEKFSGPVDQHAIKLDFIRRARRPNPAFRLKVPVSMRRRVVVPGMVRHHYARPPPLQPSRREYLRCATVIQNLKNSGLYESSESDCEETKHTICMNLSCGQYCGGRCGGRPPPGEAPRAAGGGGGGRALRGASTRDAARDLLDIEEPKLEKNTDSSSELSDSDLEYLTAAVKRRRVSQSEDKSPNKRGRNERLELRPEGNAEELLAAVENQLKKLDERLVKLLAWQRLQQVLIGEQRHGLWRGTPLSLAAEACVARSVDRGRLARHGFRHVALPSELLSRTDRQRIAAAVWGRPRAARPAPASPTSPTSPAATASPTSPGHSLSDACVRATVCAVSRPARNGLGDGLGRPIPMRLSSLTVGTDSGCDVRLDARLCRNVSRNHAVIFMDEVSRHFELINYSEWGSRVNGVMYACDISLPAHDIEPQPAPAAPPAPPAPPAPAAHANQPDADERAAALRDIVRHRITKPHRINGNLTSPSASDSACPCRCGAGAGGAGAGAAGAWEGSALVPHGALLQFGCLMYVFSITDVAFPAENYQPAL